MASKERRPSNCSGKGRPIQDYVGEMYPSLIKKMVEDGLLERAQCPEKASRLYPNITGYD